MKRAWRLFKEYLGDLVTIFCGLLLLYIFVTIEIQGKYGQEPNAIIRWVEIALGPVLVFLGIDNLVRDMRQRKAKRENP
mgnify:CR=1 FL=1